MLKVDNFQIVYPNGVQAVQDAAFCIPAGIVCGIIGSNGSGKSSLIKGMLGLVPARGTAEYKGEPLRRIAKKIAYVEQQESIDKDFPITVSKMIETGTYPGLGFFRRPGKKEKELVAQAIEKLGLQGLEHRQIGELSGGQFQRVMIARALAQDAELLFLDEPFVGIDVTSERIIIELLKELASEGKTVLVVHHDLSKVRNYFSHVIMMKGTVLAAGEVNEVFNKQNLRQVYDMLNDPVFNGDD